MHFKTLKIDILYNDDDKKSLPREQLRYSFMKINKTNFKIHNETFFCN